MRFSKTLFSAAVAADVAFAQPVQFSDPPSLALRRSGAPTTNAIQFSPSVQFSEALVSREIRSVLPTTLSSAELEQISADILERALFSARTVYAEYLQEIADVIGKILRGELNQATGRLMLKQKLDKLNYLPTSEEEGTLKDLSSDARINLVLQTNVAMAQGYGTWIQGQNPVILDQWPAQELYRAFSRRTHRSWRGGEGDIKGEPVEGRWAQAGGKLYGGKMIALKNAPVWTAISRFGTPYPPFDFNSGMNVRDINRNTAMKFGLIDRDTQIADVFYWLVHEVHQEPDPTVLPDDNEILDPAIEAANEYLNLILARQT